MPETIEIKRGDTYSLDDQLVLDDGLNTPFPLTGWIRYTGSIVTSSGDFSDEEIVTLNFN